MSLGRRLLLYFAWSRPDETRAPLETIDDRFPAIFELRRLFYPRYEALADQDRIDQGISGFLDHVQRPNFAAFVKLTQELTGNEVAVAERVADDGAPRTLDKCLIGNADTIVVISFDSLRSGQSAAPEEIAAAREFLNEPDHLLFICPHHDIGTASNADEQLAEHRHHGDRAIPPRQGFGGFARSLLEGLGTPIRNRHGLRPAALPDGSPAPVDAEPELDHLALMDKVRTFNLHPHLPHFERSAEALGKVDVLARQRIDTKAPPHPFTSGGRTTFDALLQSKPGTFAGTLLLSDATLFSSTAGGEESLAQFWSNLVSRPYRLNPPSI